MNKMTSQDVDKLLEAGKGLEYAPGAFLGINDDAKAFLAQSMKDVPLCEVEDVCGEGMPTILWYLREFENYLKSKDRPKTLHSTSGITAAPASPAPAQTANHCVCDFMPSGKKCQFCLEKMLAAS